MAPTHRGNGSRHRGAEGRLDLRRPEPETTRATRGMAIISARPSFALPALHGLLYRSGRRQIGETGKLPTYGTVPATKASRPNRAYRRPGGGGFMILASLGRHLALSGQDHEIGGASVRSIKPHERDASSAATNSAICAVFSAAPLRRLSPQTKNSTARGSSSDWRTRPTQDGSVPTASTGVGNSSASGSSATTTPGAARSTAHASARLTGRENTACTATECVVTTGTRTQVAETRSEGRPRILRVSFLIFSSSEDQPSAFSEPAHGTTFRASGAGNGPRSPIAERTSPVRCPSDRVPATLSSCAYSVSIPACPAPEAAWYDATTSSVSPNALCSAPTATISDSVVQFGFAMIPFGRRARCSGLISGTTSGTSGSIRNAPELSTATAPRSAATGAHSAETSSGTSNMATSMPSNASSLSAMTSVSRPLTMSWRPADRGEAISLISPQMSWRLVSRSSMTVPTAPVAPTTASAGLNRAAPALTGPSLRTRPPRPVRRPARTPCAWR